MNKVIISEKKGNSSQKEVSFSALRRLNVLAENMSEDELDHSGVKGMKWGVRNERESGSGMRGGAKPKWGITTNRDGSENRTGLRKAADFLTEDKITRDFQRAAQGLSFGKQFGILMLLGPYWGAKYLNKQAKDKADPKKQMAKEVKTLRKSIVNKFLDKQDDMYEAAYNQFESKYGKQTLFTGGVFDRKTSRGDKRAQEADFIKMLTQSLEKTFQETADSVLSGTQYGIKGTVDVGTYKPTFELYVKDNG